MFTWLRRWLGPGPPTRREMMAVRDACDGLEARVELHYAELKQLRGKVHALQRPRGEKEPPQDAPSEDISHSSSRPGPPSTAHLARRFRSA